MSDREKQPSKYEAKACARCGQVTLIRKTSKFCSHACAHFGNKGGSSQKGQERPAMRGPKPEIRREKHGQWKGEDAGYVAKHVRVYVTRGKASEQMCGCGKPALDWANLTGNYDDIWDYEAMCRSCHIRYDKVRAA